MWEELEENVPREDVHLFFLDFNMMRSEISEGPSIMTDL